MPRDERPSGNRAGVTAPEAETLRLLAEGDLEIVGLLPRASNYTFLAEVRAAGREALAVYKPRAGEAPLWDFPDGTLCRREVAAYLVAEALGWPAVPPTVLRDGPEGHGSVQLFVEFDADEHSLTLLERYPDEFRRVALFDAVVNNADRKSGHCLLASDGHVFVVDHGVCFNVSPKLRTVVWDFAGEPIPGRLAEDLIDLRAELERGALRAELSELLDEREVEATARRAEKLVRHGRFPEPGPGRPYPWPVV